MAKKNISKLVTVGQIQRMHRLMDYGYSNLSNEDARLLDKILDLVTTALHDNTDISLRATNHLVISDTITFIDKAKSPAFFKTQMVSQNTSRTC